MTDKTVFISYTRKDIEAARRLHSSLLDAGFIPWLDELALLPGQNWKRAITEAIRNCRHFIALLSSNSVNRKGFVQREIIEAIETLMLYPESDIYLIPVRLDNCVPSHEKLKALHWVNLFPDWDNGINRLIEALSISHLSMQLRGTESSAQLSSLQDNQVNPDDGYTIKRSDALSLASNSTSIDSRKSSEKPTVPDNPWLEKLINWLAILGLFAGVVEGWIIGKNFGGTGASVIWSAIGLVVGGIVGGLIGCILAVLEWASIPAVLGGVAGWLIGYAAGGLITGIVLAIVGILLGLLIYILYSAIRETPK